MSADLAPSLAFTAESGWHLAGGLAEQVIQERDEACSERDHLRRQAARKGDAVNFDEALDGLLDEAEACGLSRQAEKVRVALDKLRADMVAVSERKEALAAVAAAEEALRVARERAGLSKSTAARGRYNISEADRERRREQCARMREARAAKRAA